MSLALDFCQVWLRDKMGLKSNECGVQFDCQPPNDAGQFYIGIDDGGVEAGPENTNSLRETLNINIGIWRKPEHLSQKDRKGILQLPRDKYLLGAYTIADLERKVIVKRLNGLHHNAEFLLALNEYYGLPDVNLGSAFNTVLWYKGRSKMQFLSVDVDANTAQPWYGYLLRFRGLVREQRLVSTYASG